MAQVTIQVNSRAYTVACDDGEEEHLKSLAREIDHRVAELARSVGQVGDARLLLMASLILADEMTERAETADGLEQGLETLRLEQQRALERAERAEDTVAHVLEATIRRIEDIAARLD